MFVPKKIIIENFLSIEKVDYEFKPGRTILVQGLNLTDPSQESNGSGKSAFQAAIIFALTGSYPRKTTDKEMVRDVEGIGMALVNFDLYDTLTSKTLSIIRTLSVKDSSTLKILEDGEVKGSLRFATIPEGNKLLISLLGITVKDIQDYYFPNELTYVSFFRSSDTDNKNLISRFSKTDVLDSVYSYISKDVEELDSQKKRVDNKYLEIATSIGIYKGDVLVEEQRDINQEKKDYIIEISKKIEEEKIQIEVYRKGIEKDTTSIEEYERESIRIGDEITKVSNQFEKLSKESDRSEFFKELEETQKELNAKKKTKEEVQKAGEKSVQELKLLNSRLDIVLGGQIKCPKCSYVFLPKSEKTLEEVQELKKKTDRSIKIGDQSLEDIKKTIANIQSELDEVAEMEEEVNQEVKELQKKIQLVQTEWDTLKRSQTNNQASIKEANLSIASFNRLKTTAEESIKTYEGKIKDVDTLGDESKKRIDQLNEKIRLLEEELEKLETEKKRLDKELFETQSWINYFKSFRSYLVNKQLKAITGYTNKYLRDFGTDIEVSIEGFKQLSSGEIREKITPYVYRKGKTRNYGLFSKGERAKIDYAVMLALQTLINLTSTTGGLDIMFPDEVIEGVDSLGLMSLLKALSLTGKTNLLTTHVTGNLTYSDTLLFVKENDITKIR